MPAVVCGCETLSLILRGVYTLTVFYENAALNPFLSKREDVENTGDNCMMRSFMIFTPYQILFG
jgi:hypothetical protein